MLDLGEDANFSYELGEGIAGRYASPMRRYSFDDTTASHNYNTYNNTPNNNNDNMNINTASMSNNNNSITYESPSSSPRASNDTKGKYRYYIINIS